MKNTKIHYNEYKINFHGKFYDVLIPTLPLDEVWVWQDTLKNGEGSFVEGNRNLLQAMWDASVTLITQKDKIVYFPTHHIHHIKDYEFLEENYDMVFYNHQIQLKRSDWKDIRGIFKHSKSNLYTIKYSLPDFLKNCEKRWERYERSDCYYREKNKYHEWFEYGTLFMEGNADLHCEYINSVYLFMQSNLEEKVKNKFDWFPYTYFLGLEYYYMTEKLYFERVGL